MEDGQPERRLVRNESGRLTTEFVNLVSERPEYRPKLDTATFLYRARVSSGKA